MSNFDIFFDYEIVKKDKLDAVMDVTVMSKLEKLARETENDVSNSYVLMSRYRKSKSTS